MRKLIWSAGRCRRLWRPGGAGPSGLRTRDRAGRPGHARPRTAGCRAAAVDGLLARPLTAESAVRVALLNSPAVAVQLEAVGVATADFVTAAQVRNPEFYIAFRPPDRRPPSATDIEATMSEDVLDLLLLPLRKQIAQRALDQSAVWRPTPRWASSGTCGRPSTRCRRSGRRSRCRSSSPRPRRPRPTSRGGCTTRATSTTWTSPPSGPSRRRRKWTCSGPGPSWPATARR